ncbi:hypothetical protein D5S17_15920 [Pseudonocardiaceae bacterium YIM PH 21723]|nr:hypothetical protein D5S17_15920 [Pseudonocardiaceae bacterium YIM PH 21723]
MEFNEDAQIDTSEVGSGGGGVGGRVALGGGGLGIVGLIIYFVLSQLGGTGGGGLPLPGNLPGLDVPRGGQVSQDQWAANCKTGADANKDERCALTLVVNSVQAYWTDQFARSGQTYQKSKTNFFNGAVNTGCGNATSDVGPFYCPADNQVYIDVTFFKELESKFGAVNSNFVKAYVLGHEYGHHIQNLLGTNSQVDPRQTGPTSGSVRLELQADCYAGVWANHATKVPNKNGQVLIKSISEQDVVDAADAAGRIGDDFIQKNLGGGRVDPSKFSHGSSEQRKKWLKTGLQSGNPASCDTFKTSNLG